MDLKSMDAKKDAKRIADNFIETELRDHPMLVDGLDQVIVRTTHDEKLAKRITEIILQDPRIVTEKMPRDIDSDPSNNWAFHKDMPRERVRGWIWSINN